KHAKPDCAVEQPACARAGACERAHDQPLPQGERQYEPDFAHWKMRSQMKHVLILDEEHDRSDQESPAPAGAAEKTEDHCRHCYVKQQHEVNKIRVGNHSDLASAARSTLPLAVMGNASRKTNLRGNMYTGRRSPSWLRRLCASLKSDVSFRANNVTKAVSDWAAPFFIKGITTASRTVGSARRFASTSPSSMRYPLSLICSSTRPSKKRRPSRNRPRSPVLYARWPRRSKKARAVRSGRPMYPGLTLGPAIMIPPR